MSVLKTRFKNVLPDKILSFATLVFSKAVALTNMCNTEKVRPVKIRSNYAFSNLSWLKNNFVQ